MKIVYLNTSILTEYGDYSYSPMTLDEVKQFLKANPNAERLSAIGHQVASDILTELLEEKVEMNRIQYKQQAGDFCIVFKLNGRPEEGKILSRAEVEEIGYSFGKLWMSATYDSFI